MDRCDGYLLPLPLSVRACKAQEPVVLVVMIGRRAKGAKYSTTNFAKARARFASLFTTELATNVRRWSETYMAVVLCKMPEER